MTVSPSIASDSAWSWSTGLKLRQDGLGTLKSVTVFGSLVIIYLSQIFSQLVGLSEKAVPFQPGSALL